MYYRRQMEREHENMNLNIQIVRFLSMQAKITRSLVAKTKFGIVDFQIYQYRAII